MDCSSDGNDSLYGPCDINAITSPKMPSPVSPVMDKIKIEAPIFEVNELYSHSETSSVSSIECLKTNPCPKNFSDKTIQKMAEAYPCR